VQEVPLKAEIPDGYAGMMSYWREGKLICQRYLTIRVERVEKKYIDLELPLRQALPESLCDFEASDHPYLPPIDMSRGILIT
jgi:hypothetical protein